MKSSARPLEPVKSTDLVLAVVACWPSSAMQAPDAPPSNHFSLEFSMSSSEEPAPECLSEAIPEDASRLQVVAALASAAPARVAAAARPRSQRYLMVRGCL